MKHLAFQTEEKTDKGTTTKASGTNWRKVISPKVRKQVIKSTEVNSDTTGTTSRTKSAPHRIGIASKYMPNKAIQRVSFDQVNWS